MRKTNVESLSQQATLIGLTLGDLISEIMIIATTGPIFIATVEER